MKNNFFNHPVGNINFKPSSNSEVSIYLNGQLLTPAGVHTFQDYSVTGSNVFFSTGSTPQSDDLILSVYYKNT